jgi:hypothetical protein
MTKKDKKGYSGTCQIQNTNEPGKFACEVLQWNLCKLTSELSDILWHPTKIYGPKVFLLTKIKPEYSYILYNPTHFHGSLVFCNGSPEFVITELVIIVRNCYWLIIAQWFSTRWLRQLMTKKDKKGYSGTCQIQNTNEPWKCVGLYRRISGITFIRYAQNWKTEKPNNLKFWSNKTKGPKG